MKSSCSSGLLHFSAAAASAAVVQRAAAECKTQGHRGRLSRASRRHRGWHRTSPIRGGGRGGRGKRKRGEGQPDDNCFDCSCRSVPHIIDLSIISLQLCSAPQCRLQYPD